VTALFYIPNVEMFKNIFWVQKILENYTWEAAWISKQSWVNYKRGEIYVATKNKERLLEQYRHLWQAK
jgi:hypothetical protein